MRAGWCLLLVLPSLAGCLDGEGFQEFRFDVPVWRAGDRWVYEVAERRTSSSAQEPGTSASESGEWHGLLVLEVANTTLTLQGEPVYHAWSDRRDADETEPGPGGFRQLRVHRKADLAEVGGGYAFADRVTVNPLPRPVEPVLQFPITPGSSWRPFPHPGSGMASTGRAERLTVEEGHEVVALRLRGTSLANRSQEVLESMIARSDTLIDGSYFSTFDSEVAWRPDVGGSVRSSERSKTTWRLEATDVEGARFQRSAEETFARDLRLANYTPGDGREQPLAMVSSSVEPGGEDTSWLTVGRTPSGAVDVGQRPATVSFEVRRVQYPCNYGSCKTTAASLDASKHRINWSVARVGPGGSTMAGGEGSPWSFTFTKPGEYDVELRVIERSSGVEQRRVGTRVSVTWTRFVELGAAAGQSADVHLADFGVPWDGATLAGTVRATGGFSTVDDGRFYLEPAGGLAHDLGSGRPEAAFEFSGGAHGTWSLDWRPNGPVTSGLTLNASVAVRYGSDPTH